MSFIVFAIQTVPDTETGGRKYDLGNLEEKEAIKAITHLQQPSGNEELPHFMQRIVAISSIYRGNASTLDIDVLEGDKTEFELLSQFFKIIKTNPVSRFISWNNKANDLPVMMYRCLKNGIPIAPLTMSPSLSLKQELSHSQPLAECRQQDVIDLLGLDNTATLSPWEIWQHWREGNYQAIQANGIHKVYDAYRIFLRYQYIMSEVTQQHYEHEIDRIDKLVTSRMNG